MRLRLFSLAVILCGMLLSCDYVDVSGVVSSLHTIDKRFADKDNLPEITFDLTIDTDNFSFLVISDAHFYHENNHTFRKIANDSRFSGIDFVIANGDNVQSGLQYQYDYLLEDLQELNVPCYFGMGNHDLYNGGYETFRKNFGRTIYTLHIGKTDIFIVDSGNGTLGTAQTSWLESELKNSSASNKIIITHYSLIDAVFQKAVSFTYDEEGYRLINMFEKYDVDYCVMGHLHFCQETTIRGVHYVQTASQAANDYKYALFTITDGKLTHKMYR